MDITLYTSAARNLKIPVIPVIDAIACNFISISSNNSPEAVAELIVYHILIRTYYKTSKCGLYVTAKRF